MAEQVGRECYLELRGSAPYRHAGIVVPGLGELPLRLLSRASVARLPPEESTMEYEWAVPAAQLASILQVSSLTCVRCYVLSNSMHAAGLQGPGSRAIQTRQRCPGARELRYAGTAPFRVYTARPRSVTPRCS